MFQGLQSYRDTVAGRNRYLKTQKAQDSFFSDHTGVRRNKFIFTDDQ